MGRWRAWVFGLLALVAGAAAGQPGVATLGPADRYDVSHSFTYLEDPGGRLALDEVRQPALQAAFRPVPPTGYGANFGFTHSAIWLRLVVRTPPAASADWLLELAYAPLDHVEVFTQHDGFGYQRQVGGDLEPFAARVIPHRHHVFPVRFTAAGESVLYLRLRSEGTVTAPVMLWQPRALWQHDQAEYGALSLYFGLLLGLLFYNLLLFMSVRDIGYLVYVGFVATMAIGQAALTGVGLQFLWPQWISFNNVLPVVALSSSAVFGLQFARHFLSSAVRMPRLDPFMLLQIGGWACAALSGVVLPYSVAVWIVTFMAMVSVATMMVVGTLSIRRGFAGAHLFFTAWVALLAGVVTLGLHNSGVLPSNVLTVNSLLIGSAAEMVLLSFALADRINVARRFKEKARERIAAEQALVGALRQAQERLTGVLQEREAMLHSMGEGIVLTIDGRIEWVNRKFAQMVGHPADVLLGHPTQDLEAHPGAWERFRSEARAALVATGRFSCEHELRRADGAVLRLHMTGTCLRERDPAAGVLWTFVEPAPATASDAAPALSEALPAGDRVRPG